MREIKFRAWDKKRKEMIYDGYVDGMGLYRKALTPEATSIWVHTEIMQFTGLLDKNGKEIYEEDIVKTTTGLIRKIIYKQTLCAFVSSSLNETGATTDFDHDEVIGNIYENPELLNEQKGSD